MPDGPWCTLVRDWATQRPLDGVVARDDFSRSTLTDAMVKLVVAGFIAKAYNSSDPARLDLHKRKHINVVASRQKEFSPNKVNLIDVINLALAMFDFAELHRTSKPFSNTSNSPSHPVEVARREMQEIAKLVMDETAVRDNPRELLFAVRSLTRFLCNEIRNYHWIPWYVVLPMTPPVNPEYERIAREFCNGLPHLNVSWLFRDDQNSVETHPAILSNWMVCLLEASLVRRWSTLAKLVRSESVRTGKSISRDISYVIMKTLLTAIAHQHGKIGKRNLQEKIDRIASAHSFKASTGVSFRNLLGFAEDMFHVKTLITEKRTLTWELVAKISANLCQIMASFRPTANPCVPYQICWVMNLQRLSKEYALSEPTSSESYQRQVDAICRLFKDPIRYNAMNSEMHHPYLPQAQLPGPSTQVSPAASSSKKRPAEEGPCDIRGTCANYSEKIADQDTIDISRVMVAGSSSLRQVSAASQDVTMTDRQPEHVIHDENATARGALNAVVCRNPGTEVRPSVRALLPKEYDRELDDVAGKLQKIYLSEERVNSVREASRKGDNLALSVYGALLGDDDYAYARVIACKRKNVQRSVQKLVAALQKGNMNAVSDMFEVIYNAGLGPLPQNVLDSVLSSLKSIARTSVRSALVLGQLLYRGAPGLEPIPQQAYNLYGYVLNESKMKNSQRGIAHNTLGAICLYSHPEGPVDTYKAILHYKLAQVLGNEYALTHMANLYQYEGEFEKAAAHFQQHFLAEYPHGMTYFTISETCPGDETIVKRTDYALRVNKTSYDKFVTSIRQAKVAQCLDYVEEVVSKQEYVSGVKGGIVFDMYGDWDTGDANAQ